jgi:elongation factor Ts
MSNNIDYKKLVAALRKVTNAALNTCKKALEAAGGDMEAAIKAIQEAGHIVAGKKSTRPTEEGYIFGKMVAVPKDNVNRGILLVGNCETDFVGNNELFQKFMAQVGEMALEHRITNLADLLTTPFSKEQTVEQARQTLVGQVGENIKISRYEFLETTHELGLYVHKGRYGCLVEVKGSKPEVAKDIAVHVVVSSPTDLNDLLQQEFYKDPSQSISQYLALNKTEILRYIHCILGESDKTA